MEVHIETHFHPDDAPAVFGSYTTLVNPIMRPKVPCFILTERILFFSTTPNGSLICSDVHHEPWPIKNSNIEIVDNTLLQDFGCKPLKPDLVHASSGVSVVVVAESHRRNIHLEGAMKEFPSMHFGIILRIAHMCQSDGVSPAEGSWIANGANKEQWRSSKTNVFQSMWNVELRTKSIPIGSPHHILQSQKRGQYIHLFFNGCTIAIQNIGHYNGIGKSMMHFEMGTQGMTHRMHGTQSF